MLVLSRKVRERILLEIPPSTETQHVSIDLLRILDCTARIGITAPREINIAREEIAVPAPELELADSVA